MASRFQHLLDAQIKRAKQDSPAELIAVGDAFDDKEILRAPSISMHPLTGVQRRSRGSPAN